MRIMSLKVKGYRSLRDVSWGAPSPSAEQLQPRTVVFGPNAAGKSNLLRALDLLLVRAPRVAKQGSLDKILVADEPVALHLEQEASRPATASIILEQDLHAAISVLENAKGLVEEEGEHRVAEQFIARLGSTRRAQVEIDYTVRTYDTDRTVQVSVERIAIMGEDWFQSRGFRLQDDRGNISLAHQSKATQIVDQWVKGLFDADLFRALTHGFVRVDCPRLLHADELRSVPDIPDDRLANRLNVADGDPKLADRLDQFREHIRREHGRIGIRTSWRPSGSTPFLQEYLELILTHLSEFQGQNASTQYIPARFRGTGFVQVLHILSSCYLSGASVLGIEELEVNLAPDTQWALWQWLGEEVGRHTPLEQVLVTSHSPVFLRSGEAEDGRAESEPRVYYAKLDGSRGTMLRRLQKDSGEDASTQEMLIKHFGTVDESLWALAAASWSKSTEGQDSFEALYVGDRPAVGPFTSSAFRMILDETRDQPDAKLTFVKVIRIHSHQPSPLKRALSLNEWISDTVEPRQIHVEWTEPGTWDAERRVRVEGAPTKGEDTDTLVLYVEEKLRREQVEESQADEFWSQLNENLSGCIETLRIRLSGN